MSNDYHFITTWRVEASASEVKDILKDSLKLPEWWPSVYLGVTELDPGDATGKGQVIDLYTKGWLPYTLRWKFTVTEPMTETGGALTADGDFAGTGVWTFQPDGDHVIATYDWRIRAEKPMLRRLTWLMRPIFAANHRWAMAKGEQSLALELKRRRAQNPTQKAAIPPPPPATFRRFTKAKKGA